PADPHPHQRWIPGHPSTSCSTSLPGVSCWGLGRLPACRGPTLLPVAAGCWHIIVAPGGGREGGSTCCAAPSTVLAGTGQWELWGWRLWSWAVHGDPLSPSPQGAQRDNSLHPLVHPNSLPQAQPGAPSHTLNPSARVFPLIFKRFGSGALGEALCDLSLRCLFRWRVKATARIPIWPPSTAQRKMTSSFT
uniref:Uncharacterized protein n=1 Tax=Chrysemys picta bellii TaxID=8478 RepID=A0A8C3FU68_CHRPI